MKKYIFAALMMLCLTGLTACDDGRIYKEQKFDSIGRAAKLTGTLTGMQNWPSSYSLAVAGFVEGDEYAVFSRTLTKTDGDVSVVVTNIDDKVTSIQFCLLDRLRRHVITFYEAETEGVRDTVRLDVGKLDVSMYNVIQQNYFNTTCANCHGASNRVAADLYLTEGKSYGALVNADSRRVEGMKLVEPGNAEASVLHMVLHQESVEGISMNHFDLVSESSGTNILPIIDTWINNGAKEK